MPYSITMCEYTLPKLLPTKSQFSHLCLIWPWNVNEVGSPSLHHFLHLICPPWSILRVMTPDVLGTGLPSTFLSFFDLVLCDVLASFVSSVFISGTCSKLTSSFPCTFVKSKFKTNTFYTPFLKYTSFFISAYKIYV